MSTPKMDADYFIRKFSKIPARLWCVGTYKDGERRCALGHCGTSEFYPTPEGMSLNGIMYEADLPDADVINDKRSERYPQKTPRARILAALRDAKKAGR